MIGKIGFIVSLLAIIVNYNTDSLLYFWLSLMFAVIILVSGYVSSYIIAKPHVRNYKDSISQMEQRGATDQEIKEFMNHAVEDVEFDSKAIPIWLSIITLLSTVTGFILLIVGIINRLNI